MKNIVLVSLIDLFGQFGLFAQGCDGDPCIDLINNNGFEQTIGCMGSYPYGWGGSGIQHIDCWRPYTGSPDIIHRPMPTPGCIEIPWLNMPYLDQTWNGGNNFKFTMMDGWPFHVETIQQTLNQNLITGQEYTLSFVALKAWHETTPNSSLSVHVRFSDGLLPFQGNSDISNILSAAALLDVGVPPIQVNNGVWIQHSVNFTYNGTQYLDNVIIIPIGQGYGDWLFIDDVSLTMVNPPTFNIPNVLCQNAIYTLPEISQDGFTGAWFPATINTTNLGTSTYTFLPNNP